jgi:hypothetical protein|tara:strand:+ start:585 stop:1001 length:417 start_codon:yes stop_codon:yes gene_type:complete
MIPQVIKLSNGENIICTISESENSEQLKVTSPLKMDTFNKVTDKGVVESLGLSRWIQPYSDEPFFKIEKSSVVIMTPASAGLCKYYEYVVHNIENMVPSKKNIENSQPTQEELNMIEEEEHYEELEEFLDMFESDTIH